MTQHKIISVRSSPARARNKKRRLNRFIRSICARIYAPLVTIWKRWKSFCASYDRVNSSQGVRASRDYIKLPLIESTGSNHGHSGQPYPWPSNDLMIGAQGVTLGGVNLVRNVPRPVDDSIEISGSGYYTIADFDPDFFLSLDRGISLITGATKDKEED
jgi:hypothetical protein